MIFLIGQLPHNNEPLDAGVRADAETLADLLVTDLNTSSSELRKKVPDLLAKLVAAGDVMQVDAEYRMQTREGSEWNQAYNEARSKILGDPGKLGSERSQLLRTQCSDILKKSKLTHGLSKVDRKFELHFGADAPSTDGSSVPVWIRDGWEVQDKTVVNDARAAGDSTAIVFGHVPQKQAEELKHALAAYYAATTTLQTRGTPASKEGIEARKAMETRQEQAQRSRDNTINDILNETTIYVAGGDIVNGMLLENKVQDAVKSCLDRLFPQFHQADSPDWHKVIARKADGDALASVGHKGDPESHPVCKAVIDLVGSGKRGSEIRKHFANPPYGWPQDAVDAALMVLSTAGILQARSGTELIAKGKLDQKNIAAAEFRVETITLSTAQLIEIRKLFKLVGLNIQANQESANVPEFLNRLRTLADGAGGDAPAPKIPDLSLLTDLGNRVGNEQLKGIFDSKEKLTQHAAAWQKNKEVIAQRLPRWQSLQALLAHAADLPVAAEVKTEVQAIADHRRLLDEPDPVPGFIERVTEALRKSLNEASGQCKALHAEGQKHLDGSQVWKKLKPDQQKALTEDYQLAGLPTIAVGTTEEVLATLNAARLKEWKNLADALPTRFGNALAAAAKLLEPKAQHIKLSGGTIKNEDDLKTWLSATEQHIRDKLKDGPVIL